MQALLESQAGTQKAQLEELEAAILGAEDIIPEDLRERYRRTVKQRGADAMAFVENSRLLRLLRLRHLADDERADQRPQHELLHELRPDPLPGRGRYPQHATIGALALTTLPRPGPQVR